MQCPVCGEHLRAIEKYGVEIDICPGCKGVWLDRGELEKILDLEAGSPPPARESVRPREDERRYREELPRAGERGREHDDDRRHGRPHRRESWLSNILESFGGDD